MLYLLIMILGTIILGSIVPVIQFFKFKITSNKTAFNKYENHYQFSRELLNSDLDNLKFENVDKVDRKLNNRLYIAERGWVRGPNGTVLSLHDFEEKKSIEYEIELP